MESQGFEAVTASLSSAIKNHYQFFIKEHSVKSYQEEKSSDPENPIKLGLSKWLQEYNNSIQDHGILNETVNAFMAEYDKNQISNKQENADDEGWTVVSKKGRNPGISRKQSVQHKIVTNHADKLKRKQLTNFYGFQLKEQRIKQIVALRQSFEKSKEQVQKIKQLRTFKPLL